MGRKSDNGGLKLTPLKAKILVVDDEHDIRALTGKMLSSEGYYVAFAEDGEEALELMKAHDYDLVILDVMMPNKHGLDVVRAMKRDERLKTVPTIIFSALGTGTRLILEDENQADDYIQKPFMRKEFLHKVEKLSNN